MSRGCKKDAAAGARMPDRFAGDGLATENRGLAKDGIRVAAGLFGCCYVCRKRCSCWCLGLISSSVSWKWSGPEHIVTRSSEKKPKKKERKTGKGRSDARVSTALSTSSTQRSQSYVYNPRFTRHAEDRLPCVIEGVRAVVGGVGKPKSHARGQNEGRDLGVFGDEKVGGRHDDDRDATSDERSGVGTGVRW